MPRQLEIRTTILAKKSQPKSREKDANANDVYADEALQLLEEIQKLKENVIFFLFSTNSLVLNTILILKFFN